MARTQGQDLLSEQFEQVRSDLPAVLSALIQILTNVRRDDAEKPRFFFPSGIGNIQLKLTVGNLTAELTVTSEKSSGTIPPSDDLSSQSDSL